MNYVFDLEAESLNLGGARPWQVSILGEDGFFYYKNIDIPDLKVSLGAARVTRFQMESHKRIAVSYKKVAKDIYDIFADKTNSFVAHNGLGYDIYILKNFFDLAGVKFDICEFAFRLDDSLAMSRGYHFENSPPKRDNKIDYLAWQYKMLKTTKRGVKTSLGAMAKEFNLEYDPEKAHDARYDTEINLQVYKKLCYALDI